MPQLLILGLLIAGLLVAAVFLAPALFRQSREQDLLTSGTAAKARVLELSKTGISRGPNTPLVRLKLEVQPSQEPTFQVELEIGVSVVDLPKLQPGSMVAVRYDPRDRAKVLIVP